MAAMGCSQLTKIQGGSSVGPGEDADARRTVSVQRRDIESVVTLDGVVTAAEPVQITAPKRGVVTHVVESGAAVEEGEPLARLQLDEGERMIRSSTGGVVERVLVEDGAKLSEGQAILSVRPGDFFAVASIEPSLLYRFYDGPQKIVGSIDRGPSGFPCDLMDMGADPEVLRQGNPLQAPVTLECGLPDDLEVFSGVRILLAVTTARASDVLALPVTAVDGDADRGVVSLVAPDGSVEQRKVRLGVTDGVNVEVERGLEAGQEVLSAPRGIEPGGGTISGQDDGELDS